MDPRRDPRTIAADRARTPRRYVAPAVESRRTVTGRLFDLIAGCSDENGNGGGGGFS